MTRHAVPFLTALLGLIAAAVQLVFSIPAAPAAKPGSTPSECEARPYAKPAAAPALPRRGCGVS